MTQLSANASLWHENLVAKCNSSSENILSTHCVCCGTLIPFGYLATVVECREMPSLVDRRLFVKLKFSVVENFDCFFFSVSDFD
jgi:hypothetical protein